MYEISGSFKGKLGRLWFDESNGKIGFSNASGVLFVGDEDSQTITFRFPEQQIVVGEHLIEVASIKGVGTETFSVRDGMTANGNFRDVVQHEQTAPSPTTPQPTPPRSQSNNAQWIKGTNGMVRYNGSLVEIKRTSKSQDFSLGLLVGDKAIPLRTIQAIQFKGASATVGGMIEFVVAGDRSNSGQQRFSSGQPLADAVFGKRLARMSNENVITFNRSQEPSFVQLHQQLLTDIARVDVVTSPPPTQQEPTSSRSIADEIRQLKVLVDEGILTMDEFEAAKKSLLNL